MKKKLFISISSILLAAIIAAGLVYALFLTSVNETLSFSFGNLTETVTTTDTTTATTSFSAPGDTKEYDIDVNAAGSQMPFGYEISLTRAAGTDADFAKSVLVYMDGRLVGTVASAIPDGAEAFSTETYTLSPDRILNVSGTDKATHKLKLVYHLGAGAAHSGKTVALGATVRASTLDAQNSAVVTTAKEYDDIMRHMAAGRLPEGYRVILGGDITSAVSYAVGKSFVLDLNGYNLSTDLTAGGAPEAANVRVISYKEAELSGKITIASNDDFIDFGKDVTVSASTLTGALYNSGALFSAVSKTAGEAIGYGVSAGGTIDFAGGNKVYLIKDPNACSLRTVSGSAASAVAGSETAITSDGVLDVVIPKQNCTLWLEFSDGAVTFNLYGESDTSAAVSELDALMAAQSIAQGAVAGALPITYDLLLPRRLSTGESVSWESLQPAAYSSNGVYVNTTINGDAPFLAKIKAGNTVETRQYTAHVEYKRDYQVVLDEILNEYGDLQYIEVGENHFVPTSALNLDAQKSAMQSAGFYTGDEQVKWERLETLIRNSGMLSTAYTINPDDLFKADGALEYDAVGHLIRLKSGSTTHIATLTLSATFPDDENTYMGQIPVYIDVASVSEAWKYYSSVYAQRGDIASNIQTDRYHYVGEDGSNQTGPAIGGKVFLYHGTAAETDVAFGTADTNGVTTPLNADVREGSFILPMRFTSASSMMFMNGDMIGAENQVRVYYYYAYSLSATALSSAINESAPDGKETLGDKDVVDPAVKSASAISTDITSAAGATLASIPDYNNFFIVDPAKLPLDSTSYTLNVGVYQKAEDGTFSRVDVQTFSLSIPGAIHNDADGFSDAGIFSAVHSAMQSGGASYVENNSFVQCPGSTAKRDTIVKSVAAQVRTLKFESTADNIIQATGSVDGLGSFTGLTTLTMNGIEGHDLFPALEAQASGAAALAKLTRLTNLTMKYCGIASSSFVSALTNLETVDFCCNAALSNIDGFLQLTHIKSLDVRYCGFGFTRTLDWQSSYGAVSVFDAIYFNENVPDDKVIKYSYKPSGGAETDAVYTPGRASLSANAQKAKEYALMIEPVSTTINTYVFLPTNVFVASNAVVGYRGLINVSGFSGVNNYAPVTISGDSIVIHTSISGNSFKVNTTAASGSKVVIQMFIAVGDGITPTSTGTFSDFYSRILEFTVV